MMAMDTEGYERNVYQGFGNESYGYEGYVYGGYIPYVQEVVTQFI